MALIRSVRNICTQKIQYNLLSNHNEGTPLTERSKSIKVLQYRSKVSWSSLTLSSITRKLALTSLKLIKIKRLVVDWALKKQIGLARVNRGKVKYTCVLLRKKRLLYRVQITVWQRMHSICHYFLKRSKNNQSQYCNSQNGWSSQPTWTPTRLTTPKIRSFLFSNDRWY